jgi:hypothetical protein
MKFIRRLFNLFLFFLIIHSADAQRLNTGFTFELYGIHPTKFPSDVFFSNTSYKAYYIEEWQSPKKFSYNFGISLIADYSRFFVNTKLFIANTSSSGVIYKYRYPIGENDFKDYYSRIEYQQAELIGSLGYFLNTQKYFKPYVELGIGRTFPYFYSEDVSTDESFDSYWSDQYELRDYIELDKQYTFVTIGLGYKGDIMAFYGRYNIRVGNFDVYYSNFYFGLSVYTKFSKLRKHYIYQPGE